MSSLKYKIGEILGIPKKKPKKKTLTFEQVEQIMLKLVQLTREELQKAQEQARARLQSGSKSTDNFEKNENTTLFETADFHKQRRYYLDRGGVETVYFVGDIVSFTVRMSGSEQVFLLKAKITEKRKVCCDVHYKYRLDGAYGDQWVNYSQLQLVSPFNYCEKDSPNVSSCGVAASDIHPAYAEYSTILKKAHELVHGDRNSSYGHPLDDYTCNGRIFAAHLTHYLRANYPGVLNADIPDLPAEIAIGLMIDLKVTRNMKNFTLPDGPVDIAGYADCMAWSTHERNKRELLEEKEAEAASNA
jgi:hypothetical protein